MSTRALMMTKCCCQELLQTHCRPWWKVLWQSTRRLTRQKNLRRHVGMFFDFSIRSMRDTCSLNGRFVLQLLWHVRICPQSQAHTLAEGAAKEARNSTRKARQEAPATKPHWATEEGSGRAKPKKKKEKEKKVQDAKGERGSSLNGRRRLAWMVRSLSARSLSVRTLRKGIQRRIHAKQLWRPNSLQQAPQQEAQASAWQASIFLHGSAISATQDHRSFLEGKQPHESNRCPWNSFPHQIYIFHVLVWRSALECFECPHLTWLPHVWIAGNCFEGSSKASWGKELHCKAKD